MHGYRLLLAAVFLLSGVAAAQSDTKVRQAMARMAPQMAVDAISPAPLPGFQQVTSGGQIVYISDDGRYALTGSIYDTEQGRDLTERALADVRRKVLAGIPADKRLRYAPADSELRHQVTVFTDIDCPYCRALHEQLPDYLAHGIAIDYVFFPLSIHPGADQKAVAVWCSRDRHAAYDAAMAGNDPGQARCPNPVAETAAIARAMGLNGTPTMLDSSGRVLTPEISMSPDRLIAELEQARQTTPQP